MNTNSKYELATVQFNKISLISRNLFDNLKVLSSNNKGNESNINESRINNTNVSHAININSSMTNNECMKIKHIDLINQLSSLKNDQISNFLDKNRDDFLQRQYFSLFLEYNNSEVHVIVNNIVQIMNLITFILLSN